MAYDNTNRGVLFRNENKRSDKQPDYSGTFNKDGTEFKIAGWEKVGKSGKAFISLSVDTFVPKPKPEAAASDNTDQDPPF